jgi:cation transport protein ChaC
MDDAQRGRETAGHDNTTLDTTARNRVRQDFTGVDSVWLFGYGSLIWKVGFPYLESRPAALNGGARRLWQGSHDHRGTPVRPGRVATLGRDDGAACVDMAYRIAPATLVQIDRRVNSTASSGRGRC